MGIMSVTGHRHIQSLNAYIKPSDGERRIISGILSGDKDSSLSVTSLLRPQVAQPCRFLGGHPTRPCLDMENHLSQFNTQSNSKSSAFSIFSGNITGGNVTVNIYKE